MEFEQAKAQLLTILKKHYLPLGLGTLGMIFFAYGLISLIGSGNSSGKDIVFEAGGDSTQSAKLTSSQIAVDVEGAVVKTGIFKLSQDSRIQDALIAAGGLSVKADRAWINKNLNLASKLNDGAKLYIPSQGENYSSGNTVLGVQTAQNSTGLVNINNATASELDTLPGVGVVTAGKIINGRPYATLNELLEKKIVGAKVFSQIKDKISVN